MYEHFTDAENTGVPLVPLVQEPTGFTPDEMHVSELEEAVLSHRLRE